MGDKPTPENSGGSGGKRKPPVGRRFQKGQSGNPGGRPKTLAEFKELTRNHSAEAVEKLVRMMRNGPPTQAVRAAEILLDRAWGKPAQRNEIAGVDGAAPITVRAVLTSDEKRARQRALAEKAAALVVQRIASGEHEPGDADG